MQDLTFSISVASPDVARVLKRFTREQLRDIARAHNVRRGRDKVNTLRNLIQARIPLDLTVDANWWKGQSNG